MRDWKSVRVRKSEIEREWESVRVSFEHRDENKSCSACQEWFNERLKECESEKEWDSERVRMRVSNIGKRKKTFFFLFSSPHPHLCEQGEHVRMCGLFFETGTTLVFKLQRTFVRQNSWLIDWSTQTNPLVSCKTGIYRVYRCGSTWDIRIQMQAISFLENSQIAFRCP